MNNKLYPKCQPYNDEIVAEDKIQKQRNIVRLNLK